MTNPTAPARRAAGAVALAAVLALAGCNSDSASGEVTGTVTVNGETPPVGSSINFVPTGAGSSGGGGGITDGKYAVKLPVGNYKVEIRVPRPVKAGKVIKAGPGPGAGVEIEESLPAKYNEKTELTFEVKPGKNEKNWELKR
jgi:hypothetical protein